MTDRVGRRWGPHGILCLRELGEGSGQKRLCVWQSPNGGEFSAPFNSVFLGYRWGGGPRPRVVPHSENRARLMRKFGAPPIRRVFEEAF